VRELAEIKVKRKGYWRGPYTYTRNGKVVNVQKSWVPETTFMSEDKLLDATDKKKSMHDRYVEAGRMIQELANVTVDEDTKKKAKEDADYFFEKAKEK
jgi:hypothetical protein